MLCGRRQCLHMGDDPNVQRERADLRALLSRVVYCGQYHRDVVPVPPPSLPLGAPSTMQRVSKFGVFPCCVCGLSRRVLVSCNPTRCLLQAPHFMLSCIGAVGMAIGVIEHAAFHLPFLIIPLWFEKFFGRFGTWLGMHGMVCGCAFTRNAGDGGHPPALKFCFLARFVFVELNCHRVDASYYINRRSHASFFRSWTCSSTPR